MAKLFSKSTAVEELLERFGKLFEAKSVENGQPVVFISHLTGNLCSHVAESSL